MRRFGVFILGIIVYLGFGWSFGYFEDRVFCDIEGENVTIFLKNESGMLTCKTYMDSIYQLTLKRYDEIMAINSYIAEGEDVYYRKNISEKKKKEFLQLVNYKNQIKMVVDKFESTLFEKYYGALYKPMQVYYSDLETSYYILINQTSLLNSSSTSLKIAQLEQQMGNVSRILNAKNLDDIMEVVSSYIYLKKQIEGI